MLFLEDELIEYGIKNNIATSIDIFISQKNYKTKNCSNKVYDLASLTKTICGYIIVNYLQGKNISLEEEISVYINVKTDIKFIDLLIHKTGLEDSDFKIMDKEVIFKKLNCRNTLDRINYADINYIILFHIIDTIDNAKIIIENFFINNKLDNIFYNPVNKDICVENQKRSNRITKGVVHDTKCYNMSGISFHAGLFSDTKTLEKFYQIVLNDVQFIKMTEAYNFDSRCICFIKKSNEYDLANNVLFHTGYSGTSVYIDLKLRKIIIILSNRTYIEDFSYQKIKDYRNYVHNKINKTRL